MKKIIATVLAMVMALALCTTAFAANPTYTKAYEKDGTKHTGTYELVTVPAVKYNKDTGAGQVKTYTVTASEDATYSTEGKVYVESSAASYNVKLTADGRTPIYLSEVIDDGAYLCKAVAYTNIGEKCEQFDGDADTKYYTNSGNYESADDAVIFEEADADDANAFNVLVDGKLVVVTEVGLVDDEIIAHEWEAASYNKDNTVATYKCSECKTVATVYKTVDAAKAAGVGTVEVNEDLGILGYTYGKTADTKTDGTSSPKTFDAGIAMYVGMALTSVAGSAVVIGKKKEF